MSNKIESHLVEERVFKPSKEFSKKARISSMAQYRRMYKESIEKPSVFWAREAKELLWQKPWKKVLEWKAPFANAPLTKNSSAAWKEGWNVRS